MASAKFEIYHDKSGRYRWRLVSASGQTTASSGEGFASHANAKRAVEHVKKSAVNAEVVESVPDDPHAEGSAVERVTDVLTLTIHYEDAGDGWTMAQVAEVPGAISQGRTRDEARANVLDALRTVLTPDERLAGKAGGADDEPITLTFART